MRLVLEKLEARPILDLGLRLGEGSGAALALPILRLACALHNGMATFARSVRLRAHLVMFDRSSSPRHDRSRRISPMAEPTTPCAEGWAQFESQTAHRNWPTIVTSPRRRTRSSAAACGARNLTPRIDEDWAELDFGLWMVGGRSGTPRGAGDSMRRSPRSIAIPRQIRLRRESWASSRCELVVL